MSLFDFSSGAKFPGQPQFVSTTFTSGVLVADMAGPTIGSREAPIIAQEVAVELEANVDSLRTLLIDLTNVTILSSVGLEMCINLRNKAHTAGASTVLRGVNAQLTSLMKMMKTERLWEIVEDAEDRMRAAAA